MSLLYDVYRDNKLLHENIKATQVHEILGYKFNVRQYSKTNNPISVYVIVIKTGSYKDNKNKIDKDFYVEFYDAWNKAVNVLKNSGCDLSNCVICMKEK